MELIGKMTQRKATTSIQFELLLKEIGKQPLLAKDYPLGGENRAKVEVAWNLISEKLNNIGPPSKKPSEWRKVWTDLRSRTKKKINENITHLTTPKNIELFLNTSLSRIEKEVHKVLTISNSTIDLLSTTNATKTTAERVNSNSSPPPPPPPMTQHLENDNNELIIPKLEPDEFDELDEFIADSEELIQSDEYQLKPLTYKVSSVSASSPAPSSNVRTSPAPVPPPPPSASPPHTTLRFISSNQRRKKRRHQEQMNLLKQQLKIQKKSLKITQDQKRLTHQQLAIFSKIADAMTKQATAVEKQANAIISIFDVLKQRKS